MGLLQWATMKNGRFSYVNYAIAAALVVLVAVLAALQYRWLGELSRSELDRMRTGLQAAAGRFAEDFSMELIRVSLYFRPPRSTLSSQRHEFLLDRYRQWEATAPLPRLVADVYYAGRVASGDLRLERLDPASGRFEPVEWPPEYRELHDRLAAAGPPAMPGEPGPGMMPAWFPFERRLLTTAHAFQDAPPGDPSRGRFFERPAQPDFAIVRLDPDVIEHELLPGLAQRHFPKDAGMNYDLIVTDRSDPSLVVFRSDPGLERADFDRFDARADLFAFPRFEERRGSPPRGHLFGDREPPPDLLERLGPGGAMPEGGWDLLVRHHTGSLEAAVRGARRRNLAISLGTLLLLLASVVMLLVTTHRARELARQRMEFVAGVSHELRTPLAVICSAGQNLADGVVADPDQVKRYGDAIRGEGKRLSELVEHVLQFSELQSNANPASMRPVGVSDLIDAALADCRSEIVEADVHVEKQIAQELPDITADPAALQRALRNLIVNAIKYGADARWLGIAARRIAGHRGPEVLITVRDRGPGISAKDLPHIFEPFYRGWNATSGGVPGSGLGLSLVRSIVAAHHGRVEVESTAGGGSSFSIWLPVEGGR